MENSVRVSAICRFPRHASRVPEVQQEVRVPQLLALVRATRTCPDPGQEHVEGERLGEVVVGPGVQAANDLLESVARGQQQDRGLEVLAA
jgi:hypothetical protein